MHLTRHTGYHLTFAQQQYGFNIVNEEPAFRIVQEKCLHIDLIQRFRSSTAPSQFMRISECSLSFWCWWKPRWFSDKSRPFAIWQGAGIGPRLTGHTGFGLWSDLDSPIWWRSRQCWRALLVASNEEYTSHEPEEEKEWYTNNLYM